MMKLAVLSVIVSIIKAGKNDMVWLSSDAYKSCNSTTNLCSKKYFGLYKSEISADQIASTCKAVNATPWCPETEAESRDVYANFVLHEHPIETSTIEGWLPAFVQDGMGAFSTGLKVHEAFDGLTKLPSNYVCENNEDWDSSALTEAIFTQKLTKDDTKRCVGVGGEFQLKWTNIYCKKPAEDKSHKHRPICVTTANMTNSTHHFKLSSTAAATLEPILQKAEKDIKNTGALTALISLFFFTGGCFGCFCCCCMPCRSGDSHTETTTTDTQLKTVVAPPTAAPVMMPPPPPPMMPAYGGGFGAPPQQPVMNITIKNNNENTN